MDFQSATFERVLHRLSRRGEMPDIQILDIALRILAKWRSTLLANTLVTHNGLTVQNGPFAGMEYVRHSAEGTLTARLLGCYESELHPHIEALGDLDHILDIGCAEGYYAVGFARKFPRTKVHAFDIDSAARAACQALADKNGVQLTIDAEFNGERFADYAGTSTLVFCDIEGGEQELLDPDRFPALRRMTLIVETHPSAKPGVTERLAERFGASHYVERIEHHPALPKLPAWTHQMHHLDLLLLAWEWRHSPTPWLVMRPRSQL